MPTMGGKWLVGFALVATAAAGGCSRQESGSTAGTAPVATEQWTSGEWAVQLDPGADELCWTFSAAYGDSPNTTGLPRRTCSPQGVRPPLKLPVVVLSETERSGDTGQRLQLLWFAPGVSVDSVEGAVDWHRFDAPVAAVRFSDPGPAPTATVSLPDGTQRSCTPAGGFFADWECR